MGPEITQPRCNKTNVVLALPSILNLKLFYLFHFIIFLTNIWWQSTKQYLQFICKVCNVLQLLYEVVGGSSQLDNKKPIGEWDSTIVKQP